MSNLQQFVIEFFNTLGAIVEEVDYALVDVLIDDKFKNIFKKTELKLCFDYEVYLENPEYELVTFGSFILDKIIDLTSNFSNTSIRYAVVDTLNIFEPEKKIKKFLKLDRTNIEIIDQTIFMNYFVKYSFKISYISDNTIEEFEDIVLDMNNFSISNKFHKNLDYVFYDSKPQYDYPINCSINFLQGLKKALKEIDYLKELKKNKLSNNLIIKKEIKRINIYYDSLKFESEKRMKRKNLTKEKINEYKHKIKTYDIEKQRQSAEIAEKYRIKSNITLENVIVYSVPIISFKYKLTSKNKLNEEFVCLYNTALKEFY